MKEGGEAVSATRIRAALAKGEVDGGQRAARLAFRGRRHRHPRRQARPRRSATRPRTWRSTRRASSRTASMPCASCARTGRCRDGVASYGRRPTFGGGEPVLETFVFDFSGDLYGETVLVSSRLHPPGAAIRQRRGAGRPHGPGFDRRARAAGAARRPGELDRRLIKLGLRPVAKTSHVGCQRPRFRRCLDRLGSQTAFPAPAASDYARLERYTIARI